MQFSATLTLALAYLAHLGAASALPVEAAAEGNASDSLVKRNDYWHCACQYSPNGAIDPITTARVVDFNSGRWTLETFERVRFQGGAKFTGTYAVPVKGAGKIGGRAFYNECRQNGAGDSTCF
ncbi:hypothetical protein GQ44DRAFT_731624 [Phaeosphaeriaceae sp. PMI808]|nr:hypothetical protein GQ44DRAFT_731624 [Phaeosphaeriaceae sp. PMI808]